MRRFFPVLSLVLAAISLLGASSGATAQGGGYDEWGYNYTAHRFSGDYCDAYHGASWCQPYVGTQLDMQWNDAWRNSDGEQPDSHIGTGAWLTNHMRGEEIVDGKVQKWTYFVKIEAKPTATYSCAANGGYEIWDDFCVVQEVQSGIGVLSQPVNPGLGN